MTYKVVFYQNAVDFLGRALTDLSKDETRNNLILGLALRLKDDIHAYTENDPMLAIVTDEQGANAAMAIMTPPFPMILHSDPVNSEALETLADALIKSDWQILGVNGEAQASDVFALIWKQKTGLETRINTNLRAYELKKIEDFGYPPGRMRVAKESDAQIVCDMLNAMRDELVGLPGSPATPEGALKSIRLSRTFFWVVDDQIVSITTAVRPQIKGICISGVYTPPEFRRRGYARALVAEVTREMFARGYQLTNLFTDLANPTSNKIYQEIGYKPVCDYHQYTFEAV